MMSRSMLFVAVVLRNFFHSSFLLLSQMGVSLRNWLLLMGLRSFMLLVGCMSFVNSVLLMGLMSLLMTSLMLAWVVHVTMMLLSVLLSVNVNTSNSGSIINEHSFSVRKMNQPVIFVGFRQPHVVIPLQLGLILLLSLTYSSLNVSSLLVRYLIWRSRVVSMTL
jgi:hypothetical protein